MPILKNVIQAYNTWKRKWGTKLNLSISKGGVVPVENFIKVSEEYESATKRLSAIIIKESSLEEENESLRSQISDLQSTINNYNHSSREIYQKTQHTAYSGFWKITYEDRLQPTDGPIQDRVEITNEVVSLIEMGQKVKTLFYIRIISYNVSSDQVCIGFEDPLTKKGFFELFTPHPRGELKILKNLSSYSHKRVLGLERE